MTGKQIKTLIVDDEPLARNYIRRMLAAEHDIKIIGECGNGREAAHFIQTYEPDLVFLDIQMPEMDGFTMIKNIDNKRLPLIIFTTAYEKYAVHAFEIHALDYLLKPFDQARFKESVKHAKESLGNNQQKEFESRQVKELLNNLEEKPQYLERLLIKVNGRIVFLNTSEIDWIKAEDKYINIYFGKSSYLSRQPLSIIKTFLNPKNFVQIHRSIIVNIERINELQQMFNGEYTLSLKNGVNLAVSRNFKNQLFDVIGRPI